MPEILERPGELPEAFKKLFCVEKITKSSLYNEIELKENNLKLIYVEDLLKKTKDPKPLGSKVFFQEKIAKIGYQRIKTDYIVWNIHKISGLPIACLFNGTTATPEPKSLIPLSPVQLRFMFDEISDTDLKKFFEVTSLSNYPMTKVEHDGNIYKIPLIDPRVVNLAWSKLSKSKVSFDQWKKEKKELNAKTAKPKKKQTKKKTETENGVVQGNNSDNSDEEEEGEGEGEKEKEGSQKRKRNKENIKIDNPYYAKGKDITTIEKIFEKRDEKFTSEQLKNEQKFLPEKLSIIPSKLYKLGNLKKEEHYDPLVGYGPLYSAQHPMNFFLTEIDRYAKGKNKYAQELNSKDIENFFVNTNDSTGISCVSSSMRFLTILCFNDLVTSKED